VRYPLPGGGDTRQRPRVAGITRVLTGGMRRWDDGEDLRSKRPAYRQVERVSIDPKEHHATPNALHRRLVSVPHRHCLVHGPRCSGSGRRPGAVDLLPRASRARGRRAPCRQPLGARRCHRRAHGGRGRPGRGQPGPRHADRPQAAPGRGRSARGAARERSAGREASAPALSQPKPRRPRLASPGQRSRPPVPGSSSPSSALRSRDRCSSSTRGAASASGRRACSSSAPPIR
jgi:hypothetical protein